MKAVRGYLGGKWSFGLLTANKQREDYAWDDIRGDAFVVVSCSLMFALLFTNYHRTEVCTIVRSDDPGSHCIDKSFSMKRIITNAHDERLVVPGEYVNFLSVVMNGDTGILNDLGAEESCIQYIKGGIRDSVDTLVPLGYTFIQGSCRLNYTRYGPQSTSPAELCSYERVDNISDPFMDFQTPYGKVKSVPKFRVVSLLSFQLVNSQVLVNHEFAPLRNNFFSDALDNLRPDFEFLGVTSILDNSTNATHNVDVFACPSFKAKRFTGDGCAPIPSGIYDAQFSTRHFSSMPVVTSVYYLPLIGDAICGVSENITSRLGKPGKYHYDPPLSSEHVVQTDNNMFEREKPGSPYICVECKDRSVIESVSLTLTMVWVFYGLTLFSCKKVYYMTKGGTRSTGSSPRSQELRTTRASRPAKSPSGRVFAESKLANQPALRSSSSPPANGCSSDLPCATLMDLKTNGNWSVDRRADTTRAYP
eukprot:1264288-Amorphochlora_amoeboformis.AAC.1